MDWPTEPLVERVLARSKPGRARVVDAAAEADQRLAFLPGGSQTMPSRGWNCFFDEGIVRWRESPACR